MAASKEAASQDKVLETSKEEAMQAYQNLLEAKTHFRKAAEAAGMDLKSEATDQLLKGKDKAEALGNEASRYMNEKPLATLGVAFIAGFVFSQLFSRK
ncbi:hypothetical protein [Halopseudomonas salegens]|uniref:DUF883 domain-containing protein n=1 Tax=Halopseudomonas salegens TaxID=1434072 RepID=A0A1H2H0C9_9GAMM|nr:hypothetical protein [Halopseudomonas salegens]SDU25038.1 hypothetical protein SAMN05216210_2667 [Halopseudomonas salegens]